VLTRIRQTLAWLKDCIEHFGFWGWHRSLWLRDIEAERAIDQEIDELLRYLKGPRGLSGAGRARVERAESHIRRLRAQRGADPAQTPLRSSQRASGGA
jgi:hypothetical protein